MKTRVNMCRELFGVEIEQRSDNEMFNATSLIKAGNKWRVLNNMSIFNLTNYFKLKSTIEFIDEMKKIHGKVIIKGHGKYNKTWVHPNIFIDIALHIHPKLKVTLYDWVHDNLINNRNSSGDSYQEMCGALFKRCKNIRTFQNDIKKIANDIRKACGVSDWEHATEEQLKKRDKIHDSAKTLSYNMTDIHQIARIAIECNQ